MQVKAVAKRNEDVSECVQRLEFVAEGAVDRVYLAFLFDCYRVLDFRRFKQRLDSRVVRIRHIPNKTKGWHVGLRRKR